MSDSEIDQNLCESDQEVSNHHSKLIKAVIQLDKTQRVKKAERNEPSIEVSEYHLVKSGECQDAVRVQDLVKLSTQKRYQNDISKRLGYIQQKNQILARPLEKPAAERIKRTVGYDNVKKELTKWDAIVTRNRTAERLFFPLKEPSELKDSSNSKVPEFLRRFTTKSDLMKKIEEVDPLLLYPPAEEKKEDNKYKLTKQELIMRRKETARFRAQQSYKEAKAKRQNKIKSKKFHRIQRKGKIKQQLKEFEELKNSNPQEALAKLEQLDKARAEERMSLRHKNTGQWARNKQIRTKYDKEARQVLANQLTIGRELTQKVKRMDEKSDDSEDEDKVLLKSDKESTVKTESEIDEFIKNYRKYWEEKNEKEGEKKIEIADEITEKEQVTCSDEQSTVSKKNARVAKNKKSCDSIAKSASHVEECSEKTGKKRLKKLKSQNVNETSDPVEKKLKRKIEQKPQKSKKKLKVNNKKTDKNEKEKEKDEDYLPNLEFPNPKQRPILDCPLDETTSKENERKRRDPASLNKIANTEEEPIIKKPEVEIDPKKFLHIKPKHLLTQLPDMATYGDDDSDQEQKMRKIMSEAFADDDVIEEFNKEKEEEMKNSQLEEIDLSLPGWGNWAGTNISKRKVARKKKRFILNVPKEPPRRPENKGKVIIFEQENAKLKKHLVNELPYPFTRVTDFEATLRAPISRTFVPMNAHMRLTQPTVNTKLGHVIEPMDENELVKNQPMIKKPLERRIDKKSKKRIARNNEKRSKQNKTIK